MSSSLPAPPPGLSSGRVVRAKSGCLENDTIVLTGEFENFTKEQVKSIIEKYGGRVTSAVSGKTTILVHADKLEDGRSVYEGSKYRDSLAQNAEGDKRKAGPLRIYSENAFFDYLDSTLPQAARTVPSSSSLAPHSSSASSTFSSLPSTSSSTSSSASSSSSSAQNSLWTDKYRPSSFNDLVGNQPAIRSLDQWIRNWEGMHLLNTIPKPQNSSGWGPSGKDKGPSAKAALISGPPGIGKSTAAAILGRHYGYDILELNASDNRAARHVKELLTDALGSSVISFGGGANSSSSSSGQPPRKRLVIMDEVDGMSSGDRGGNAELIKLIKTSLVPLICICNDRADAKVRSLALQCYDIKFQSPSKEAVAKRLCEIAKREGLIVDIAAAEGLSEACGGDIRQMLNTLQMWAVRSKRMSNSDLKSRSSELEKDEMLRLDAFSAAPRLFKEARKLSVGERLELFMVDYDMIPLLVQQAVPMGIAKSGESDGLRQCQMLSQAVDSIAEGDIYSQYIRSRQQWGLLPAQAIANVRATSIAHNPQPQLIPFPLWLGKNSSCGKRSRLLAELGLHISAEVSGGREAIRLDYFDPLRTRLMSPLIARDATDNTAGAAAKAIAMLDQYGLSSSDLMETMIEVSFSHDDSGIFIDYAKRIDPKVKAAFTREYKKISHKAQSLRGAPLGAAPAAVTKSKGGAKSKGKGKRTSVVMDKKNDDDDDDDDEGGGGESDLASEAVPDDDDDDDDHLDVDIS
jgi:replication factor C subunit 1